MFSHILHIWNILTRFNIVLFTWRLPVKYMWIFQKLTKIIFKQNEACENTVEYLGALLTGYPSMYMMYEYRVCTTYKVHLWLGYLSMYMMYEYRVCTTDKMHLWLGTSLCTWCIWIQSIYRIQCASLTGYLSMYMMYEYRVCTTYKVHLWLGTPLHTWCMNTEYVPHIQVASLTGYLSMYMMYMNTEYEPQTSCIFDWIPLYVHDVYEYRVWHNRILFHQQ